MAAGRWGSETAAVRAAIDSAFSGKPVPNPFAPAPPQRVKTEAERQAESARAWRVLDRYFAGGKGDVWTQ